MARSGYDERTARGIGTTVHTAPEEVGPVLNATNPRHAVLFHHFNDFDTAFEIEADVRKTYSGPLTLAKDLMVFNVTKEEITVRMTIVSEHVWPNTEEHEEFRKAPREKRPVLSDFLTEAILQPKELPPRQQ